jgi:hypothetical protein
MGVMGMLSLGSANGGEATGQSRRAGVGEEQVAAGACQGWGRA